jgi:hypothetical protein
VHGDGLRGVGKCWWRHTGTSSAAGDSDAPLGRTLTTQTGAVNNRGNTQIIEADEGRVQNIADLDVLGVPCQVRARCRRVTSGTASPALQCVQPHSTCALSGRVRVTAPSEYGVVQSRIRVVQTCHTSCFTSRVEVDGLLPGHRVPPSTRFRQNHDELWIPHTRPQGVHLLWIQVAELL